ncbi:MAG: 30S ribosomal protein S2, partial [Patescibacteria group bacterium]|nr:30S ribosomal protein S2 [Patescibacteria group bacterium]
IKEDTKGIMIPRIAVFFFLTNMKNITLEDLLKAGCHFGHKAERWHPRSQEFIYTEKDGIHIIDLAKTKHYLEIARSLIKSLAEEGKEILFVGTKRQAKNIVKQFSLRAGAPYLVERWIGGFLTNWQSIRKNIEKINRMQQEKDRNEWQKFPKHEQVKLSKYLERLKVTYEGVLSLTSLPGAIFVTDGKKEYAAVKEANRMEIPVIGIVDTNVDPSPIDYPIPANDDAVGSIECIIDILTEAYKEGKEKKEKETQEQDTDSQEHHQTGIKQKRGKLNKKSKEEPEEEEIA